MPKGFKAIWLEGFDGKIWEKCRGLCLEVWICRKDAEGKGKGRGGQAPFSYCFVGRKIDTKESVNIWFYHFLPLCNNLKWGKKRISQTFVRSLLSILSICHFGFIGPRGFCLPLPPFCCPTKWREFSLPSHFPPIAFYCSFNPSKQKEFYAWMDGFSGSSLF